MNGISSKLAAPVWAAFRRHCHRLIAIGYQEALPRILTEPDEETDITGYICEALKNWFRNHPDDFFGFDVHDDPPIKQKGKTGKRRSRSDIIITFTAGRRPEFYFEAKRLHRSKAGGSRYISEDGMGCFISARYASNYSESAMIGYVQTDSLEYWHHELIKRIEDKGQNLKLETMEKCCIFEYSFPFEWSSTHGRDGCGSTTLFHILLDCSK